MRALAMGAPTRKRILSILETKLDQHPQLFAETASTEPAASAIPRTHANVRGPEYFRCTTPDQGDTESCSSNPPSI